MNIFKKFGRSQDGSVAVEFAVVSLIFFAIVFSIVEFSRLSWTKQAVTDISFRTVRCAAVGSAEASIGCRNSGEVVDYAVTQAGRMGITLAASQVSFVPDMTCNGYQGNLVTITFPFQSPFAGLIPGLEQDVSASSCYPV